MFERGRRLKAEIGDNRVFDFSLGNPNAEPPAQFFDALRRCAAEHAPAAHRYMPNAGFDETRAAVAAMLSDEYGTRFDAAGVLLTSGAAGATNVVLHSILDPGDEVIVLVPCFPEYRFYIEHAQGRMVSVETDSAFQPDIDAISRAITSRTRAILINSPNNPTGAVYSEKTLRRLADAAAAHDRRDRPLYLISDDVYRRVVFDMPRCPTLVGGYARTIVVSSYSKDLSIPGERLGYVAIPPATPDRSELMPALTMLNRTLGFVSAPAFMQRVVARCAAARCDIGFYRQNRDRLCDSLRAFGYELETPAGALYVFAKTPIEDDVAFIDILLQQRILAVPGRGFGRPAHMRLSYCVDRATIEGSLAGFREAIMKARNL